MLSLTNRLARVAGHIVIALQPNNSWVAQFQLPHVRANVIRTPAFFNGQCYWFAGSVAVLPIGYLATGHYNRFNHSRQWFLTAKAAAQHAVAV